MCQKNMNPSLTLLSNWEIVEQIGFFSLGMATGPVEEKKFIKNIEFKTRVGSWASNLTNSTL